MNEWHERPSKNPLAKKQPKMCAPLVTHIRQPWRWCTATIHRPQSRQLRVP